MLDGAGRAACARKANVPGAQAAYDELRQRFAGQGQNQRKDPATAAKS